MIVCKNLSKAYTRSHPVLEQLSLSAHPGQLTLLIGANGIGKSTTLRILTGLTRPDSGDATIAGHSIRHSLLDAQRHLSYLPQQIAFHPRLSCQSLLHFYAGLRRLPRPSARITTLLQLVGLENEAHKKSGALSGGLRQRLGLATLLLPDAPVLLLDEPGLSLDPAWRERLKQILQAEAHRGKAILLATHLLAEWEGVAHRALHIQPGGQVVEIDPTRLRDLFTTSSPSSSIPSP